MMAMETEEELTQGPAGDNGFDPDTNDYRSCRSVGGDDIDGTHFFLTDTPAMEIIQTARSQQSEAAGNKKRGREDSSSMPGNGEMEVEGEETVETQAAPAAEES